MSELQEQMTVTPDLRPERVAEGIAAPWPAVGEPVLPAARAQQKVRVGLEGARVVISVMAPSRGQVRNTIGLQQLEFAAALV